MLEKGVLVEVVNRCYVFSPAFSPLWIQCFEQRVCSKNGTECVHVAHRLTEE